MSFDEPKDYWESLNNGYWGTNKPSFNAPYEEQRNWQQGRDLRNATQPDWSFLTAKPVDADKPRPMGGGPSRSVAPILSTSSPSSSGTVNPNWLVIDKSASYWNAYPPAYIPPSRHIGKKILVFALGIVAFYFTVASFFVSDDKTPRATQVWVPPQPPVIDPLQNIENRTYTCRLTRFYERPLSEDPNQSPNGRLRAASPVYVRKVLGDETAVSFYATDKVAREAADYATQTGREVIPLVMWGASSALSRACNVSASEPPQQTQPANQLNVSPAP